MITIYTKAQREAQAHILKCQIANEDRLFANLSNIPEDVRANHERMINSRRSYFVKRLAEIQIQETDPQS